MLGAGKAEMPIESENGSMALPVNAAVERAGEHPSRDGQAGLDVGVRQDHGELVAADPEGAVAAAEGAHRDAPDRGQQLVAHRVAVLVVDLLEVVHVDQQQGQRRLVAGGVLQLAAELLLEGAVVAEPGQAVEQRVLAGPPVQVQQPGAVVLEALDVADDRLGQVGHQRRDPDGAQREEGERHPGARPAGPEALDRGDAHEHGEHRREDAQQSPSDQDGRSVVT